MMKQVYFDLTIVVLVLSWNIAPRVSAVEIPLLDPGFDVYQAETTTLIPDARFITTSSGPQEDVVLYDGSTGMPAFPEELADVPAGWGQFGTLAWRFRYDAEFSQPSGTMNLFATGDLTTSYQILPGTPAQPNTIYTATIDVHDRNTIPTLGSDIVSIADTVVLALYTDVLGAANVLASEVLATPPTNGGKTTLTLQFTTGQDVPAGDLAFAIAAANNAGPPPEGQFIQTLFDNATLDASPIGGGGVFGDYNGDDKVDAADYVVWRANLGASIALPNEDATPGTVTQEDYTVWMNNFGKMAGSGTGSTSAATVPEPAGAWLLLFAFFVLVSFSTFCRDGRWRAAGDRGVRG